MRILKKAKNTPNTPIQEKEEHIEDIKESKSDIVFNPHIDNQNDIEEINFLLSKASRKDDWYKLMECDELYSQTFVGIN